MAMQRPPLNDQFSDQLFVRRKVVRINVVGAGLFNVDIVQILDSVGPCQTSRKHEGSTQTRNANTRLHETNICWVI